MISTRHAQANNPSFPDTYDANLPNQNLIYLDANNLYGWAMSQSLHLNCKTFPMMMKTVIYPSLSNQFTQPTR